MIDLAQRITDYLTGGGLFNPEQANHDAVRDLLIDCRGELGRLRAENREVAQKIIENDQVGAVKWAQGLVTTLDEDMHVTSLAQGTAAEPLTYEQIADLLQDHARDSREMHDFARAVERAHGIRA